MFMKEFALISEFSMPWAFEDGSCLLPWWDKRVVFKSWMSIQHISAILHIPPGIPTTIVLMGSAVTMV